jgi:4-hydroxy-tetrahydrodipicolinate synthase
MTKFHGTGVAIITPFNEDLTVDHAALSNLVNFNIQNGTDYIVISGTTGESVTITNDEKKAIIKTIIKANDGRVPLVLGIGGNNTAKVIEEIKSTDLSQIDALLSVSPYYSKPQQEGIYQHFKAISEVSPVDIILYNVPGRTSSNMSPETTLRLANDFKNIIAVKEAGNNVHQYLKLLRDKPENFLIISGDDDLVLGVVLAGGAGVISVLGQALPKQFTNMINLGLEGKAKEAYAIHFELMDLTSLIFSENNPAGIKAVLEALDLSNSTVRLPLVAASNELKQNIKLALQKIDS